MAAWQPGALLGYKGCSDGCAGAIAHSLTTTGALLGTSRSGLSGTEGRMLFQVLLANSVSFLPPNELLNQNHSFAFCSSCVQQG